MWYQSFCVHWTIYLQDGGQTAAAGEVVIVEARAEAVAAVAAVAFWR